MDAPARFDRDPNSPSRRLAASNALADQEYRTALVEARIEAGLSQSQVARMMGVSQSAVSQFETYDNDPKLSTVRRYAHAIGASIAHQVNTPTRTRECGTWRMEWVSPQRPSFAVGPADAWSVAVPADSTSTSFSLAA